MALEQVFEQESARYKIETGNYDQDFTKMVDRLEAELAERASFPYLGGKDPMTGKTRLIVESVQSQKYGRKNGRKGSVKIDVPVAQTPANISEQLTQEPVPVVVEALPAPDPVRLTAIIYDDFKKAYTAIMMVGERSFSVEVGDRLHGRVTREISVQKVILEDANRAYQYDISGNISNRAK